VLCADYTHTHRQYLIGELSNFGRFWTCVVNHMGPPQLIAGPSGPYFIFAKKYIASMIGENMSNIMNAPKICPNVFAIYFLLAENLISALPNTQRLHETHAEPLLEISGIDLLFSGHLAPTLPVKSFMTVSVTANVLPR
jgi:hypothetical protein